MPRVSAKIAKPRWLQPPIKPDGDPARAASGRGLGNLFKPRANTILTASVIHPPVPLPCDVLVNIAQRLKPADALRMMVSCKAWDHGLRTPLDVSHNATPPPLVGRRAAPIWRARHGVTVPHTLAGCEPDWLSLFQTKRHLTLSLLPSQFHGLSPEEKTSASMQDTIAAQARTRAATDPARTIALFGLAADVLDQPLNKQTFEQALSSQGRILEARYFQGVPAEAMPEAYKKLAAAWQKGLGAVFQLLIASGVDIHQPETRQARTPLHMCAASGQTDAVRLLVQHGARVNVRDESGDTPLHLALCGGHIEAAALLLPTTDAYAVNGWGQTLLHAVGSSSMPSAANALRWLIQHAPPDVLKAWHQTRCRVGATPLDAVLSSRRPIEFLDAILSAAGPDLNAKDERDGYTPLMWCISRHEPEHALLLLEKAKGIDLNATDADGNTALNLALQYPRMQGDFKVVEKLLSLNHLEGDADLLASNNLTPGSLGKPGRPLDRMANLDGRAKNEMSAILKRTGRDGALESLPNPADRALLQKALGT